MLVEARAGSKFWGFVKLNEGAQAASQTIMQVVQKLSDINKWADTCVLQIEVGDIM